MHTLIINKHFEYLLRLKQEMKIDNLYNLSIKNGKQLIVKEIFIWWKKHLQNIIDSEIKELINNDCKIHNKQIMIIKSKLKSLSTIINNTLQHAIINEKAIINTTLPTLKNIILTDVNEITTAASESKINDDEEKSSYNVNKILIVKNEIKYINEYCQKYKLIKDITSSKFLYLKNKQTNEEIKIGLNYNQKINKIDKNQNKLIQVLLHYIYNNEEKSQLNTLLKKYSKITSTLLSLRTMKNL